MPEIMKYLSKDGLEDYNDAISDVVCNSYVRSFDTVAAMQAATDLKSGMVAHTNGFHSAGDGGAAYYTISTSGTANGMDVLELQNGLMATLVITVPYITPEIFGAYGDGLTVDNAYLNRFFAMCAETGAIATGANGKTYLVDDSTTTVDSHYGVLVPSPVTIANMNFKLADNVQSLTCILTCVYGESPYNITNCTFETGIYQRTTARENGGYHALFFISDITFPSDWVTGVGDVIIDNCTFNHVYGYSIFPVPFDGLLSVNNCNFNDCYGVGVLTYATKSIIANCNYSWVYESTRTMVASLAHDEIEAFSAPTNIPKKVNITNCESTHSIYRCQQNTQYGIIYDSIIIENCSVRDGATYNKNQSIVFYTSDATKTCTFDNVAIVNCKLRQAHLDYLNSEKCFVNNTSAEIFRLGGGIFELSNSKAKYIYVVNDVDELYINECIFNTPSSYYGCISSIDLSSTCGLLVCNNTAFDNEFRLVRRLKFNNCTITNPIPLKPDKPQLLVDNTTPYSGGNCIVKGFYSLVPLLQYQYTVLGVTGYAFVSGIGVTGSVSISGATTQILDLVTP